MISLREVPLSGDKLLDWIFKQFVFFLRRETLRIKRKKRLCYPKDRHRKAIWGLMEPEVGPGGHFIEITINSAKSKHKNRDEELETLIHEVCHVLFFKTRESFIEQITLILSTGFTQEQRNFLKTFLPRGETK